MSIERSREGEQTEQGSGEQRELFNLVRAEAASNRAMESQPEPSVEHSEELRNFPEGSEPGRLNLWHPWEVLIWQAGFGMEPPEVTGGIRYRKDAEDERSLDRRGIENEGFTWVAVEEIFPIHQLPKQKAIDQAPPEAPNPIRNLAESILTHGYELYPKDIDIEGKREPPITALRLSNGDLMCVGGQHRIVALAMLGEREIPVKFQKPEDEPLVFIRAVLMGNLSGLYPTEGWSSKGLEELREALRGNLDGLRLTEGWSQESIDQFKAALKPGDLEKFDRTTRSWTPREAPRLYEHWQKQGMKPGQMIEHMQRVGLSEGVIEAWRERLREYGITPPGRETAM